MSDTDKKYTLAEVRKMQCQAFIHGAGWMADRNALRYNIGMVDTEVCRRYPAPTKPRVVVVNDQRYRAVDGVIQVEINGKWLASGMFRAESLERDLADLHAIRDLLVNPEEPCNE